MKFDRMINPRLLRTTYVLSMFLAFSAIALGMIGAVGGSMASLLMLVSTGLGCVATLLLLAIHGPRSG